MRTGESLTASERVQRLQTALHAKAKEALGFRFYSLSDKVWRDDVLAVAWQAVRRNGGAAGVDGETVGDIEALGVDRWLGALARDLKEGTYRPHAVRQVLIPKKQRGKFRPLGIPCLRDRVVQTAAMLVLSPIFEADLQPEQYAYRPGQDAHDAIRRLLALPTDEPSLLEHYTLAEDDLEHIRQRRRPHNRLGFALQLCALRYPGRLLSPGEVIPHAVLRFLATQLVLQADGLLAYASREETRHEHLAILRRIYGYKTFTGRGTRTLKSWLPGQAELARSNEDLARRFVDQCRRSQTILPAISTIERLCADALVDAERRPLLQFGTVALDPTPDCRVIRLQAALAEQFFAIAERE